jgi:hypothetical protein
VLELLLELLLPLLADVEAELVEAELACVEELLLLPLEIEALDADDSLSVCELEDELEVLTPVELDETLLLELTDSLELEDDEPEELDETLSELDDEDELLTSIAQLRKPRMNPYRCPAVRSAVRMSIFTCVARVVRTAFAAVPSGTIS